MLELACPICQTRLSLEGNQGCCPQDGQVYMRVNGVWHLLRPGRERYFAQFIREYEIVRQAEGRGSQEPAYYRSLPFQDLSGELTEMWQERARSWKTLADFLSRHFPSPARILDLGAGNGWLSYRMSKLGYLVTAIDLTINGFDGLGTHTMYDAEFLPLQAEFDHLPITAQQVELAIFNASFHYSPNFEVSLVEAFRVTKGTLVILDTPIYHNSASGKAMVQEREKLYRKKYGFPSNAIASENFLTYGRLDELAAKLGMDCRLFWPVPKWRWRLRRLRAWQGGRREPAQFPLIVATQV